MKNKGKGQSMIEINSINLGKMLDVLIDKEEESVKTAKKRIESITINY